MLWYNLYHVFFVVVLEFFISFMISTQQRLYSLFLFLQNLQIALVQHSMLKEQCNAQTAGKLRKVIGYLPMVVGHCQILAWALGQSLAWMNGDRMKISMILVTQKWWEHLLNMFTVVACSRVECVFLIKIIVSNILLLFCEIIYILSP